MYAELEIRVGHSIKVGTFYRLLLASPLKICSKYVLANSICSANFLRMVGKWPIVDCYFKLRYTLFVTIDKYSQDTIFRNDPIIKFLVIKIFFNSCCL